MFLKSKAILNFFLISDLVAPIPEIRPGEIVRVFPGDREDAEFVGEIVV